MGAWIETLHRCGCAVHHLSHPTWVRGLKLNKEGDCGTLLYVAPYMGAWIETGHSEPYRQGKDSRTLHGCVD